MIFLLMIPFGFFFDQLLKYWATTWLKPRGSIQIIKNFFHFTYVENRGMAFGLLQGKRTLFIIGTIIGIIALGIWFFTTYKTSHWLFSLSLSMILSGALGNFVDRVRQGYVVDYIDVRFITNTVFNLADMLVVVGAILLSIYILFVEGKEKSKIAK